MKNKFSTSFDELIKNHYGLSGSSIERNNTKRMDDLFTNYYGKSAIRSDKKRNKPRSVVLSLSFDDGETLNQRDKGKIIDDEYVVQKTITDPMFEEYVVGDCTLSSEKSIESRVQYLPAEKVSAFQEYQVDILDPLKEESSQTLITTTEDSPSKTPLPLVFTKQASAAEEPPPLLDETSQAKNTDEDFAADLQAILTGKSVFDPLSKKTVNKDELGQPTLTSDRNDNNTLPVPESKNRQSIFDQIAQSMQYANKYDLGTIELSNRFSDFDKIIEFQEKAEKEKISKNSQDIPSVLHPGATVDTADFMQDMGAIQKQHSPTIVPSEVPNTPLSTATETGTVSNTNAEIEKLNLAEIAKKAAYTLKKKHPTIIFTSGRRSKQEQSSLMSGNVVQDRKWIEKTYAASDVREACQKWIDDNPDKITKDEIEKGLMEVLNKYSDNRLGILTKHISGMAFDIQPVKENGDDIKKAIRSLEGLDKFLEKEGDLIRWHAQFT